MFLPRFRFPSRLFLLVSAGGGLWWLGVAAALAQDRLDLKNGSAQVGRIVGVRDGNVVVDQATSSGTGQFSYNLGTLARVAMTAPAAFATGIAAYQAGNWDKAVADLKPLADQFRGLPVDWAQQATGMLGDIYLEKKDLAKAEAAYNDYRRFYPGDAAGQLRLGVGQARIAFAKNQAAQAKQQLQGITQAALKNPALVTRQDGAVYGQAFYLLGQIQEQEHGYQDALQNYLRTVTLFYQDNAVAAHAQDRANNLRAAHKDLAVP